MSSERIDLSYRIAAPDAGQATETVRRIAYEQSVELPDDVLTEEIRNTILGRVLEVQPVGTDAQKQADGDQAFFNARISFSTGFLSQDSELSQFLNLLFGNISLFRGVQLTGIDWDALPSDLLPGPAFGLSGVREHHGITKKRALSCTALKPVGLSPDDLARHCYHFALGGIDIIKDDHGLANQASAPFEARLEKCVSAVQRAADETGRASAYYPNVTADGEETIRRYEMAAEAGAGGVLLSPQLTGLSMLRRLRNHEAKLPIMAHPAFSGAYVQPGFGFTPGLYYGELWRGLGADFIIYPNAGGRFSFTHEVCRQINQNCRKPIRDWSGCFPTPGGGVQRESLPGLLKDYGPDTVFLIGGSLYQHPEGITEGSREFTELLVSDEF
jgi:ribulose-bisphosphate carboxylase large chain